MNYSSVSRDGTAYSNPLSQYTQSLVAVLRCLLYDSNECVLDR
jgi:hypothetical protein